MRKARGSPWARDAAPVRKPCAYCVGITNIDPIKYNLLFERFLNPEARLDAGL